MDNTDKVKSKGDYIELCFTQFDSRSLRLSFGEGQSIISPLKKEACEEKRGKPSMSISGSPLFNGTFHFYPTIHIKIKGASVNVDAEL